MTSETDPLKTNEFLRRRKLRLQQVREQSKDIAKKIRQRAKAETIRQVVDLDAKKQKEYFERQEKLVKHLEVLYTRGLNNLGASHRSASCLTQDEIVKTDLSKLRGKEAAAELRKKRQDKLNEQKKILDRKLQAREAANELSRDKSVTVTNKLLSKSSKVTDEITKPFNCDAGGKGDTPSVNTVSDTITKNDMATQWDTDTMPPEWVPTVPALNLPLDDYVSLKDDAHTIDTSAKSKRLDLFALSKEMPSDLRGTHTHDRETYEKLRPSLTVVSEYLQTRKLRLRKPDPISTMKQPDDMASLKQTILRTRGMKPEGSHFNVCHVLDEQVIPVPSWHAEKKCEFCSPCSDNTNYGSYQTVTSSKVNRVFNSIRPVQQLDMMTTAALKTISPPRRTLSIENEYKNINRFTTSSNRTNSFRINNLKNKKNIVVYNHNTRDTRDIPSSDQPLVVRDVPQSEDAYSQAMKETSTTHSQDKDHQIKVQDMRNKVAITKQTVEKEYKDTMNFLNSLSKDKNKKVTKTAFMDEHQQKMVKEQRQQKMEHEYKKIESNCKKRSSCLNKNHIKSKSPIAQTENDDANDLQYSWMPVPESDGNLAIHTIPNTVRDGKTGHSVKFSKVDSYHEYRSRHKHTPPTKDTGTHEKPTKKKRVKTVIVDKNTSQSSDNSSTISNTSSIENLNLDSEVKGSKIDNNSSDAERIIIYKILDTKNKKKKNKLLNGIAKSLTNIEKVHTLVDEGISTEPVKAPVTTTVGVTNTVSFEEINEGIYKVAKEDGDNLASVQFSEKPTTNNKGTEQKKSGICQCKVLDSKRGLVCQWQFAENEQTESIPTICQCSTVQKTVAPPAASQNVALSTDVQEPSSSMSTVSFKTATNPSADVGYIKIIDDAGHDAGKILLGSKNILEDNTYEVVIQLRKKHNKLGQHESELTNPLSNDEIRSDETVKLNNIGTAPHLTNDKHLHELDKATGPEVIRQPDATDVNVDRFVNNINIKEQAAPNIQSNTDIPQSQSIEEKKDRSDKGIDALSRPATSIYTQTTNSPVHRPMYFHMSSSTSTAYMSPPELILPKYLHRGYVYEHDPYTYQDETADKPTNKYNKKCRHARKSLSEMIIKDMKPKNNNHRSTANSMYGEPKYTQVNLDLQESHTDSHHSRPAKLKHKHNNASRLYKQCYVNKKAASTQYQYLNNMFLNKSHLQRKFKSVSSSTNKKSTGSSLTSIVKDYVNRLLILNREGLKAIEVADQECSSVGTPGSSIINVPFNLNEGNPMNNNRISLEHVKKALLEQIFNKTLYNSNTRVSVESKHSSHLPWKSRRKQIHKIKSLNISKHLLKSSQSEDSKTKKLSSQSTTTDENTKVFTARINKPSPRNLLTSKQVPSANQNNIRKKTEKNTKKITGTEVKNTDAKKTGRRKKENSTQTVNSTVKRMDRPTKQSTQLPQTNTLPSTNKIPESSKEMRDYGKIQNDVHISMSTQTSQNNDTDLTKLAEDKLLNMEKIANLTEKCTKRLSNLAKVLEEVRKNKSLIYGQISTSESTDSQSGQKSDDGPTKSPVPVDSNDNILKSSGTTDSIDIPDRLHVKSPKNNPEKDIMEKESFSESISFLAGIPKYSIFHLPEPNTADQVPSTELTTDSNTFEIIKCRPKPPPALSRIQLKHNHEYVVPHELSTVIEVDSPMSLKTKNQSHQSEAPINSNRSSNENKRSPKDKNSVVVDPENNANTDMAQNKLEYLQKKSLPTGVSDENKFQMIDLKQFNEIMLEPFISIHEYAKKYNIITPDEGSNLEEVQKENPSHDENVSSLHSDGSLPDVIAELLKRNIITEPFKFDSASNVNSNTLSSESTLSMLALSKAHKGNRRTTATFHNKENIAETSDTLSISSNPDLENAFKKLGMGWASSTLKKTKERLALSSSSNTSSSSLPHFKFNNYSQDIPALVSDSVSSVLIPHKELQKKKPRNIDVSKNAQTNTKTNSMIVKEFLTKELANKITFNKSDINDTEEEFITLYETKMPEELKLKPNVNNAEHSNDSVLSGTNRARTSTPVQIYKSMMYQSSSSSNVSNGLFSNADDLSSVKITPNSKKNHSTSKKDNLTIPNFSLKMKKSSDTSKSE